MRARLGAIAVSVLLSGCGGATSDAGPGAGGQAGAASGGSAGLDAGADVELPEGQEIVFEVSYENVAWGRELRGHFITADGSIYEYDYFKDDPDATAPPPISYPATEAALRARYGAPTKTGSVPIEELRARAALIPGAASGVLLSQSWCADTGVATFIGYRFDDVTKTYSPVFLGAQGDRATLNLAPEAESLMRYLEPLGFGFESCKFIANECTGASCRSLPPECPEWQVASVTGGCWGECVSVNTCRSVTDCGVCPGGFACVESKNGDKHCVQPLCASTDVCACPFAPVCAGGAANCTNLGPMRARCGD